MLNSAMFADENIVSFPYVTSYTGLPYLYKRR